MHENTEKLFIDEGANVWDTQLTLFFKVNFRDQSWVAAKTFYHSSDEFFIHSRSEPNQMPNT